MIIYVLHDFRRPTEEWTLCAAELKRQGIDFYIAFPAVCNGVTVEQSINWSHKNMVAEARHKNLPEICIMESDVLFPAPDGWQYFLRDMPATFDLYLAGVYCQNMTQLRTSSLFDHNHRIATVTGFHCYIIRACYYDRFLATPDDCHIDVAQVGGDYRVCYPFAAIQRPGWSANAKRHDVDYNTDLIPQDVYGGLPPKQTL